MTTGLLWFLIAVCGYFLWTDEVRPRLRVWWARRKLLRLFNQFHREGAITKTDWAELETAVKSLKREDGS